MDIPASKPTPRKGLRRHIAVAAWLTLMVLLGYWSAAQWEQGTIWRADLDLIASHGSGSTVGQVVPLPGASAAHLDSRTESTRWFPATLDWVYDNGAQGEYHLAETLGGGVAALDFDRDGRLDLAFTDGGDPIHWPDNGRNRVGLFRSRHQSAFIELADSARLLWTGYGHGCCVGDVDSDGFDDLFVTGYQSTGLFLNDGDGTFHEATTSAGLESGRWCATAAFGDLDLDGDLDLYVTCYADVSRNLPTPYCESAGQRIHCHPHYFDAVPDLLFENLGDGRFRDQSETSQIGRQQEYGLGVTIADLDRDRVPEIFVSDDGDRNLLFTSRGKWVYDEVGLISGVAFNGEGRSMGSMGIGCADFDGDELLDLAVTNFSDERNVLFSNAGGLTFYDRSLGSEFDRMSRASVGWGVVPLDADVDGARELFVANGHVTEMPNQEYRQRPAFYRLGDDGRFRSASPAGEYFNSSWHARGAICADLNQDLHPDLVISHIADKAVLLVNDTPPVGGAAEITLIGIESNRSAGNVWLQWSASGWTAVAERQLSSGYLSSSTAPLLLSWPDAAQPCSLRIEWPSGISQEISNLESGERRLIVEGGSALQR